MRYAVISDFIEVKHKNTLYRKGETYPKKGFKASADRVKELQSKKNAYNTPFLSKNNEEIIEDESQEQNTQTEASE